MFISVARSALVLRPLLYVEKERETKFGSSEVNLYQDHSKMFIVCAYMIRHTSSKDSMFNILMTFFTIKFGVVPKWTNSYLKVSETNSGNYFCEN